MIVASSPQHGLPSAPAPSLERTRPRRCPRRAPQEYGPDCPEPNGRRLYISYLDSVRLLRATPSTRSRTLVYHAILQGYLKAKAAAGISRAHVWVAPPQPGDDYIFHAKPRDKEHARPMTCAKLRQVRRRGGGRQHARRVLPAACAQRRQARRRRQRERRGRDSPETWHDVTPAARLGACSKPS